jgi:hypothetical protein
MKVLMPLLLWLAGSIWAGDASAAGMQAQEIMARMAANIEAAGPLRQQYVYHQTVRSSLRQTNGEMVRRERREYDVVPGAERSEKTLVSLEGEYRKGKETVLYSEPDRSEGIDAELLQELTEELVDEKDSRDGIPASLFPLRLKTLGSYSFTLKEEAVFRGRPAFRIGFEPERKNFCGDGDDKEGDCGAAWKGEIWVDAAEFQPMRISTDLAHGIPWQIRLFLGTNIKQLGFTVTYERQEENVWFPISYGTEFRLDLLWLYKRNITLSLESRDFRKTNATSSIEFEAPGR